MQQKLISWTCTFFLVLKKNKFNVFVFLLFLHWEDLITWTVKHIHEFSFSDLNTSFILLDKKESSTVLCGPPNSLEMETNYPYLHGWPQKYMSAGMWPDRILGPRTLFFFNFLQFSVKLQFYVITDNRNRNRGYLFQYNRIRTATAVFKNATTEARTAIAVFWKLTTDPSLVLSPHIYARLWFLTVKKFRLTSLKLYT